MNAQQDDSVSVMEVYQLHDRTDISSDETGEPSTDEPAGGEDWVSPAFLEVSLGGNEDDDANSDSGSVYMVEDENDPDLDAFVTSDGTVIEYLNDIAIAFVDMLAEAQASIFVEYDRVTFTERVLERLEQDASDSAYARSDLARRMLEIMESQRQE